jgi:hypothetical protein
MIRTLAFEERPSVAPLWWLSFRLGPGDQDVQRRGGAMEEMEGAECRGWEKLHWVE